MTTHTFYGQLVHRMVFLLAAAAIVAGCLTLGTFAAQTALTQHKDYSVTITQLS
ncbi:hypothetical protein [Povalibacter sp.]|uniref:hypothetical protein n=1 Tax=Povalibacter sp. TaxID=1962978 RepID=UPI002F424A70